MTLTFALVAVALGVIRLGLFIALHVMPNEYSVVRHAVSDYAVGSTRRVSSAMTWTTAVFWALLAAAVATGTPGWSDTRAMTIALVVLAVIFAALPFVPTTLEGERLTRIGALHYVMAIAWFALAYNCMGNFTRYFTAAGPGWLAGLLSALGWIAAISLLVSVVVLIVRRWRPMVFGISERIFIVAVSLYYLGVAIGLVALNR